MDAVNTIATKLQQLLNTLLPFTTPGTPLLQDVIHTAALCIVLYYGPQITQQARAYQSRASSEPFLHNQPAPVERDVQADDDTELLEDFRRAFGEVPEHLEPALEAEPAPLPDDEDNRIHNQVRFADLQPQVEEFDDPLDNAAQPGPAHPQHDLPDPAAAAEAREVDRPAPTAANRAVGAKKAKSLARRDQRRAYNEFQRAQGDQQRARERQHAEQREAALEAERTRRAAAERVLEEKARLQREERRAAEQRNRMKEIERREQAVGMVRAGLEEKRFVWLEQVTKSTGIEMRVLVDVVRAAGLLGEKDGSKTMLTRRGCVVRVDREVMEAAYHRVLEGSTGKVGLEDFGGILEKEIKNSSQVSVG